MIVNGYLIRPSSPTGGKAGKGCNKTASVQVLAVHGDRMILIGFRRYIVGDRSSLLSAVTKCERLAMAATNPGRDATIEAGRCWGCNWEPRERISQ